MDFSPITFHPCLIHGWRFSAHLLHFQCIVVELQIFAFQAHKCVPACLSVSRFTPHRSARCGPHAVVM